VTSPVVLAALAVLLLNDHVLKRAWPGIVTGKLSDVAGPVVVAALLGGAVRLWRARYEPVAWWAVAAAFALVKTVPAVNAAVPIAGVVDPWDVLGLAALPFAWRATRRTPPWRPGLPLRVGVVVVSVLAISATSREQRLDARRIDASGGAVRAFGDDSFALRAWVSTDAGRTWKPGAKVTELPEPRHHTCSARHCYRVDDGSTLEESTDGGETWREVRSLPEDADEWEMYDVAFVAGTDVVLVAVGDHGVLRREGSGGWEAVRVVEPREPIPSGPTPTGTTPTGPTPTGQSFSTGA
jgi:hypothetical protein